MAMTQISARWTGEALNFTGQDSRGNEVLMGKGAMSPTKMMLMGLAGCMGMDVLSILQKKKQDVTEVTVEVIGHVPDNYPKGYHTVELSFNVKGNNVKPEAIARSIDLSVTKYCIVGQTLQQNVDIQTTFTIYENQPTNGHQLISDAQPISDLA